MRFLLLITFLFSTVHALPSYDELGVQDEALLNYFRARYDGSFKKTKMYREQIAADKLTDGTIVVELEGQMAEFVLYHIPQAPDKMIYTPSDMPNTYTENYYDRLGDSIRCGFGSLELKKDLFGNFKCRFRVDTAGQVTAFTDRPDVPRVFIFSSFDFHWGVLNDYSTEATLDNINWQTSLRNDWLFLNFGGKIAENIYKNLIAPETVDEYGGLTKKGAQVECRKNSGGLAPYYCDVRFDARGTALAPLLD